MTASDNTSMTRGAEVVIGTCLNVQARENVVVVADMPNHDAGMALAGAARRRGAEVSLILIEPRKAHAEDPPPPVVEALCQADAAVLATIFSLSNAEARRMANRASTRIISLPGCRRETLCSGAIFADFAATQPLIRRLGEVLSNAHTLHVSTATGTDLTVHLCGRKSVDQTAMAHDPGTWAPCPNLETAVGPDEDGVDGTLVVDGVLIPGGVPERPVTVSIREGRMQTIEGGKEADALRALLHGFNSGAMCQVVEIGIGLNRQARIGRGLMAEDESQFGTLHLGFGEGRTFGVPVSAPSHVDLVIRRPAVTVDGRVILKDEQIAEGFA